MKYLLLGAGALLLIIALADIQVAINIVLVLVIGFLLLAGAGYLIMKYDNRAPAVASKSKPVNQTPVSNVTKETVGLLEFGSATIATASYTCPHCGRRHRVTTKTGGSSFLFESRIPSACNQGYIILKEPAPSSYEPGHGGGRG